MQKTIVNAETGEVITIDLTPEEIAEQEALAQTIQIEFDAYVPLSVTPLQFRKALNQMDMRTMIENYVNTLDADSKDAWEYAISFERNDPIIVKAAETLNKTKQEIDNLFRLASTL